MNVQIIATYQCSHHSNLEHELNELGIPFAVVFIEENPDLIPRYQIRHSPNLIVNGQVAFRGQPTESQLREFFNRPV